MPNSVSTAEQPLKHLGIKTWHSQHLGWNPCWELDMVGSVLGLPSGPRLLSAPQSVPGHDLSKTCPQCHSVPAAFPCPSSLPTLTVSRQALSILSPPLHKAKPPGHPVAFLLLFVGLAMARKATRCYPSFLQVPLFIKAVWVKGRERRGRTLICSFSSHCCGITGMGTNPFPGSTGRIC